MARREREQTPHSNDAFMTRLVMRALIFGVIGFLVFVVVGLFVDGSFIDNPFWGAGIGIFVGSISTASGRDDA